MEAVIKEFELQIDQKPNGAVLRLNDENGCVLRICSVPLELVFEKDGSVKKYIDITYPK